MPQPIEVKVHLPSEKTPVADEPLVLWYGSRCISGYWDGFLWRLMSGDPLITTPTLWTYSYDMP